MAKKPRVNQITVARKRVVNNAIGFDENDGPQDEWIKLYDFTCVDVCPGNTAKIYQYELASNDQNNEDTYYVDFSFESIKQKIKPPYDIKTGDYICVKQDGERKLFRIVLRTTTQMFAGCCVIQLSCNNTHPRETESLQGCGVMETVTEAELNNEEEPNGQIK